jgi:hypothetical protein
VVDAQAETLVAIEAIKTLKARYFRVMDAKDWPAFESLFTSDAIMDVSGELGGGESDAGIIRGNAAIRAFVQSAIDTVTTVHHGHMPEIEIESSSRARGIWAMEDQLVWPEGAPIRSLHGFGHYHETYERHDGHWLIASLRLTRLRVDVEMAPG